MRGFVQTFDWKRISCLIFFTHNYTSKAEKAGGEMDERFWDAMLNADRRDYDRICSEFGVSDLHLILKKLEEKKKERAQKNCKVRTHSHSSCLLSSCCLLRKQEKSCLFIIFANPLLYVCSTTIIW